MNDAEWIGTLLIAAGYCLLGALAVGAFVVTPLAALIDWWYRRRGERS